MHFRFYPYIQVTGCFCVTKDLFNRVTNFVLLYSVVSQRSICFDGGHLHSPKILLRRTPAPKSYPLNTKM